MQYVSIHSALETSFPKAFELWSETKLKEGATQAPKSTRLEVSFDRSSYRRLGAFFAQLSPQRANSIRRRVNWKARSFFHRKLALSKKLIINTKLRVKTRKHTAMRKHFTTNQTALKAELNCFSKLKSLAANTKDTRRVEFLPKNREKKASSHNTFHLLAFPRPPSEICVFDKWRNKPVSIILTSLYTRWRAGWRLKEDEKFTIEWQIFTSLAKNFFGM